jgi:hypothetical protein
MTRLSVILRRLREAKPSKDDGHRCWYLHWAVHPSRLPRLKAGVAPQDDGLAGLGRENLNKVFWRGIPEFATVLKVVHALGFKLKVAV